MALSQYLVLAVFIAVPVVQGFASGFLFGGGDSEWYKNLNKAPWTPPGWAFPVVWSTLYVLMGISSWLVWKEGGFKEQALPLTVYAIQLVLNFAWTPLFFGLQRVDIALVEIIFLLAGVAATIVVFWPVSKLAAYLLFPYIIWVSIAISLNGYIFFNDSSLHQRLNPQ